MGEFYCIIFVEYMLGGIILLDYSNLFSPNENGKITYQIF